MTLITDKISPSALDLEAEVIEQARKDPAAFRRLYDFYYEPIFQYIFNRLADEEEAADVCQSVFLKAMVNLSKYEYRGYPFGTWLYKIAANETLQYFRKHKKQRNLLISKEFSENFYPDGNEKNHELVNKLEEAIQELNEQEIQLIELKYWEKKPYQEIAYIMDLSISNAKTKMSRIYKKLQNKLKPKLS